MAAEDLSPAQRKIAESRGTEMYAMLPRLGENGPPVFPAGFLPGTNAPTTGTGDGLGGDPDHNVGHVGQYDPRFPGSHLPCIPGSAEWFSVPIPKLVWPEGTTPELKAAFMAGSSAFTTAVATQSSGSRTA